jgi:uncharacterized protein YpmB
MPMNLLDGIAIIIIMIIIIVIAASDNSRFSRRDVACGRRHASQRIRFSRNLHT